MMGIRTGLLLILMFCTKILHGQMDDNPFVMPEYPYVKYDQNKITFPGDSSSFQEFYEKIATLLTRGEGKIRVAHFGGSHVQADIYPGHTRRQLQATCGNSDGGRGFVFPYRMGKTNSPGEYSFSWGGSWEVVRNVEGEREYPVGVGGISATTSSDSAFLSFSLSPGSSDAFNRIVLFHDTGKETFGFHVPGLNTIIHKGNENGVSVISLGEDTRSFKIELTRNDSSNRYFRFYGMILESDRPGFVYNSFGINGATLRSFLSCEYFENQLEAVDPDLVIISIGTNDANTRWFNQALYAERYDSFISSIKNVAPGAAILLTVPNDSYMFSRYMNRNTLKVAGSINQLAKIHGCGVWNFYEIMGGLNSIVAWHYEGLAKHDRIHFTRKGYIFKGELFYAALMEGFSNYVEKHFSRVSNTKPGMETFAKDSDGL